MSEHTTVPAPETLSGRSPYRRQTVWMIAAAAVLVGLYLGGANMTAAAGDPLSWVLHVLVLVVSIALVTLGANWLVDSAVRLANSLGMSKVVIGLTVVAFGTSAPEFAVSVAAGLQEHGSVAIGNVVGSNIFNLGFVLGGVALIAPIVVARQVVYRDGMFLLLATGVLFLFLWNLELAWWEGAILFGALILYMGLVFFLKMGKRKTDEGDAQAEDWEAEVKEEKATWRDVPIFFGGIGAVVAGCFMLVESAVWFAGALGVPEWAIAVTVVAAGTSAPEAAVSLVAALRGHYGISAGNLIGSDLFNILGVLGVAAMLNHGAGTPLTIEEPEPESKLGVIATEEPIKLDVSEQQPLQPAIRIWHVRPGTPTEEHLGAGTYIVGVNGTRFHPDETAPRQRLRDYLEDLRIGEVATLLVVEPQMERPQLREVAVGPAKQVRLQGIESVPEEVLAELRTERRERREAQAQAGLVPAQWSIIALMGMVLLALLFMRIGWVVGRIQGAILVLVALSRWVIDFALH